MLGNQKTSESQGRELMTDMGKSMDKKKGKHPVKSRAARVPRILPRNMVQKGLREKIDGDLLVERLGGLTINLAQLHSAGQNLDSEQVKSIKLELEAIKTGLSYILPTIAALRVESDMKEGNVIESGVLVLPETDELIHDQLENDNKPTDK